MIIYIPQNIDPYNTHLKNLVEAYTLKGVEVIIGFETFISGSEIPDIIHFHFLQGVLKYIKYDEQLFFRRLDFFGNKGVRFIFTVHDVPLRSKINKVDYPLIYCKFLNYVNLFVHHGESSIDILKKEYPVLSTKHHIVCHHGDYLNDMKNYHESQEHAREILKLPLNKKFILIYGQLQFKNTSFAKEVFEQIRKKYDNTVLLMAGVFPKFKYNRLNIPYYKLNNRYLNKFRKNKILIHKRFSQYETYLLFISSDVIFLPHKSGMTSGIIPMAATLGKPFVYPDIGVFEEQADNCYAEKYECGNEKAAYHAIEKILTSDIQYFDNSKWLEDNNWGTHVEHILSSIYQ
jgi:hypothetical protein